ACLCLKMHFEVI
ncbi:degT/DnrJ/EryC1/StrS aminotransferase family protein, partial [Vibrio parahaemolyticus VPTS-2010_2]